jgi:hypothetical protein
MEINLDYILIFKTNVRTEFEKKCVADILNSLNSIQEWSIDMEDVDRVLRIVSTSKSTEEIITTLTNEGYECSELD